MATSNTDNSQHATDANTLDAADATAVLTLVKELDEIPSEIDVYEGSITGQIYIHRNDGYLRGELTPDGLMTVHVTDPDEEIQPLPTISPDEGETIEDAVDSITFAGD